MNNWACPGVAQSERKASCFPSVDQTGSLSWHDSLPLARGDAHYLARLLHTRHVNGLSSGDRSANAPGNAQRVRAEGYPGDRLDTGLLLI